MSATSTTQPSLSTSRLDRRRRWIRWVVIGIAALLVVGYGGIGWYVSGEILDGVRSEVYVPEYDTDVVALDASTITLALSDEETVEADRDAIMGIRWEGGYAQVGPATSFDATTETRPFTLLAGDPPSIGDDVVDFDSFAYAGDPGDLDVDFDEVTFGAPLGDLAGWSVPGDDTWIIAVHGLGSDRNEFLRLVDVNRTLGHSLLIIRYRNDPQSPTTDDGLILAGQEEWGDVAAAVDHAVAAGASRVVLYGPSMGGALTLAYLLEAEDTSPVAGVVLEAPLADLREVVALRSGEALPVGGPIGDSLLAVGRAVAWLRTGIDFDTIDYVERAGELEVPILLFHGMDDEKIPFDVGQAFADARPDLIEFHALSGAAHVRAWNEDPEVYATTLAAFLERIGG